MSTTRRCYIVGNNAYPSSPLTGAGNDARSWEALFKLITGLDVRVEFDAGRAAMISGFEWVAKTGGYICYSGHGSLTWFNGAVCEALCPIDYRAAGLITDLDLAEILTEYDNPITVFTDCCHGQNDTYGLTRGEAAPQVPDGLVSRYLDTGLRDMIGKDAPVEKVPSMGAWAQRNVAFATACRSNQSAYERDGYGFFTRAMITTYKPQYSLREWINRSGRMIRDEFGIIMQTPRPVGNVTLLGAKI